MSSKIVDYVSDIQQRVRGQRVLDVGCLATNKGNILIRHLEYCKHASESIGVDYNKQFLKIARDRHDVSNLYYLDIVDSGKVDEFVKQFGRYENVIATDIIEHIGNLSVFLDNLRKTMTDDGRLFVTTPNALCPNWIYWALREGGCTRVNPDHVCYFDAQTLDTLLGRSLLKIDEVMYQKVPVERIRELGLVPRPWMGKRIYVIASKT